MRPAKSFSSREREREMDSSIMIACSKDNVLSLSMVTPSKLPETFPEMSRLVLSQWRVNGAP